MIPVYHHDLDLLSSSQLSFPAVSWLFLYGIVEFPTIHTTYRLVIVSGAKCLNPWGLFGCPCWYKFVTFVGAYELFRTGVIYLHGTWPSAAERLSIQGQRECGKLESLPTLSPGCRGGVGRISNFCPLVPTPDALERKGATQRTKPIEDVRHEMPYSNMVSSCTESDSEVAWRGSANLSCQSCMYCLATTIAHQVCAWHHNDILHRTRIIFGTRAFRIWTMLCVYKTFRATLTSTDKPQYLAGNWR